ncbi:MAG: hypothetical protein NC098_03165 [Lachnoclostridium sp.]|nr:hypothetical protein [Lachnoclostridium sp.]
MTDDWKQRLMELSATLPVDDSPEPEAADPATTAKRPVIEVTFERKGRAGKQATILSGFDCSDEELKELASRIRRKLATGGSARGGEILLQGDYRTRIKQILNDEGYRTKGV